MTGLILEKYNTQFLNFVWNRFWFSNELEPVYVDTPSGVSDTNWIGMVYNELRNRGIIPILESDGWQRIFWKKIEKDNKELLEQQRIGLGG